MDRQMLLFFLIFHSALVAHSISSGCFDLSTCSNGEQTNTLVFGNFTGKADIQGTLFVGGYANLAHSTVGSQLPESYGDLDHLVVQEGLTLTHSRCINGNAVYGSNLTISSDMIVSEMGYNGVIKNPARFNFEESRSCFLNLCADRSTGIDTGLVQLVQGSAIEFISNREIDQELFNVDCKNLLAAKSIAIKVPSNRSVVINVHGDSHCGFGQVEFNIQDVSRVVWNFCEATQVDISSALQIEGSILAPNAKVTGGTSSVLNGQLIAKSFSGQGIQSNTVFHGCNGNQQVDNKISFIHVKSSHTKNTLRPDHSEKTAPDYLNDEIDSSWDIS